MDTWKRTYVENNLFVLLPLLSRRTKDREAPQSPPRHNRDRPQPDHTPQEEARCQREAAVRVENFLRWSVPSPHASLCKWRKLPPLHTPKLYS